MKIFFRRIHLYLALAAGLVIMVTCFTGAVLVFEENLQHLFYGERYFVEAGLQTQPLAQMILAVKQKVPGAQISGVKIFSDKSRSVEISYTVQRKGNGTRKTTGSKTEQSNSNKPRENNRQVAFVNPYKATVIELYNYNDSFFAYMLKLHKALLGGSTGKLIVGICTLLFLFILITGVVLWWPKTRRILQKRLTIKWQGGWKRLNHDLHIVLGFYTAIFLFIFALTGLVWSFSWVNKSIYVITNSSMQPPKPPVCKYRENTPILSFDEAYNMIKNNAGASKFYNIMSPKDSISPFAIFVLPAIAPHESASDQYFIDRYEPQIMSSIKFSERNAGQKVRAIVKPIHTASIGGTASKVIGLLVCLLGVIFPATGYIMWWLRSGRKLIIRK